MNHYDYIDPTSDESLIHSSEPSYIDLKERLISKLETSQVGQVQYNFEDIPEKRTFVSTERHMKLTAESISEKFGIGLARARATLRATTQRGVRSAILPISRRYRADRMFSMKRLNGKFATDTLWYKKKSLISNVATQLYSHKCGFNAAYHLTKANGEQVGYTLNEFIDDYGAPEHLTYDGAAVQTGSKTVFVDTIRRANIRSHVSGPRRPDENPTEAAIREVKKKWYRVQAKKGAPDRVADFGISYVCEIGNVTANSSRYAKGRTPLELITGETPDISEYTDFGFYDWVWFKQNAGVDPPKIGRWLGVSHRVGRLMSYWILPISGIPISCSTVQKVTNLEKQTKENQETMDKYDESLESRWTAKSADISIMLKDTDKKRVLSLRDEDQEFLDEYQRIIDNETLKHADDYEDVEIGHDDPYLNMELGIRLTDEEALQHARVKRRAVDEEGKPIGIPSNNPLLDHRQYEVEFLDGRTEVLTANIIAENLLAQVDNEGHRHLMIDEIEDHRVLEDAIPKSQGTYRTASGITKKKRTTRGWDIYVRWKDGSGDWVTLKDLKESYPVQLADYAIANGIQDEPAFAWWVPFVVKKRKALISKIKSKYWQRTHKYGVRVPKNVEEAKRIDDENGNREWQEAIHMEMRNNRVAFETYDGDPEELVGYQEITGHLIFDVKLSENFRKKARFVANGNKTDAPVAITYSTVVSRDSVRILLMVAALNDLDVQGADVQNAFLSAPNLEKIWLRAGNEFGSEQGKVFIVVRALYGLKSAAAAFRSFMASKLEELGFKSSIADPDVWMRPATKDNGDDYYEYILMYVDDILGISTDAKSLLKNMEGGTVKYKNGKIESPDTYLGARLFQKSVNGIEMWGISSVDYVKAAIKTLREAMKSRPHLKWPNRVSTPMILNYTPELDASPELGTEDIQFYQELIGMLRWATELGRTDILLETSLLSQYQASPRQGHLEQALHIFAYMEKKPKTSLYMDPSLPNIDYSSFKANKEDFKEYYRDADEELPYRMPKPRGKPVVTTGFVDASHAANKKNRRSHTGYLLFVNRAPIKWYSKRQQTVETSAFSAEFLALKACIEDVEYLRFKLRMFGIPILNKDATNLFCDNESVVKNSTNVDSTLNKKHSSVAYHFARWCVAAGICALGWIPSTENLADAFTKRLPESIRDYLFGNWMY